MPLVGSGRPHPRAVIFDFDRALIDPRRAWRYAVEESVASLSRVRIDAGPLVEEYHTRPFSHAMAILLDDRVLMERCTALAEEMYRRSALKRLLVHEGVGMALDALRGELVDIAAVSRLPRAQAMKQAESTGLDRFLAILVGTGDGQAWNPVAAARICLDFLEWPVSEAAYIGPDSRDRDAAGRAGMASFCAGWSPGAEPGERVIMSPRDVLPDLLRCWAARA